MTIAHIRRAVLLSAGGLLLTPIAAHAEPLTVAGVFQNAAIPVQAVMLGLVGATLAAIGVCAIKLASGPGLSGGSAYLSGLRFGGPLAGLLGGSYTLLVMFLFVSRTSASVSLNQLAPGFAEALTLLVLGFAAGAVAVIAKWAVDSRIDRAVLKG